MYDRCWICFGNDTPQSEVGPLVLRQAYQHNLLTGSTSQLFTNIVAAYGSQFVELASLLDDLFEKNKIVTN